MTAYVLVVRDPDASNSIITDGDVVVHNIDLGLSFNGKPGDEDEAVEWVTDELDPFSALNAIPVNTATYYAAVDTLRDTVQDYPTALDLIDTYDTERRAH